MNSSANTSYLQPFIIMVTLFFVVGFLTVINQQLQLPLQFAFLSDAGNLKNTLTTLITFVFFLAYPLNGGMAAKIVDKTGYKNSLIIALLVLVVGLGLFIASVFEHSFAPYYFKIRDASIPVAFFIFLLGSYVVGVAMTIMQVAANPYLKACEVGGTSSVQRITIGGTANSIGSTVAPYFVAVLIFAGRVAVDVDLNDLIIPFVALSVVLLGIVWAISKMKLPQIEGMSNSSGEKLEKSIWSFSHLTIGLIAMFMYVGVEVAVGANLSLYAASLGGSFADHAMQMTSLYFMGMLVGRLIGSTLSKISAKWQLGVTSAIATVILIAFMVTGNPWLLASVGFFHSVMWPSIFSLAIERLGKYTSKAAGVLMIGALGGGLIPLIQGVITDATGGNWTWAWAIVLVSEIVLLYYAIWGSMVRQSAD